MTKRHAKKSKLLTSKSQYKQPQIAKLRKESLPQASKKNLQKTTVGNKSSSLWSKIKFVFYAFVTVLSVFVGLYTFYPRVSIQENQLLRPYNPFYIPFVVRNYGNINIKNFAYTIIVSDIVFTNGNSIKDSNFKSKIMDIAKIKINGSNPIDISYACGLNFDIPGSIKESHISIRYTYSIPIFNIPFQDSIKFVLFKDFHNEYKWKEYQY